MESGCTTTGRGDPAGSAARMGCLVFLLFTCLYLLTMRGPPTGGDDRTMLSVAVGIVEQQKLSFPAELNLTGGTRGREGRVYAKYPIGQSLAEIPFYLMGRTIGGWIVPSKPQIEYYRNRETLALLFTVLLPVLISAGTCVLLLRLCLLLGYSARVSLATACAYGVGTMAWPYSGSLLSEPLQTFLLLWSVYLLCRYRRTASMWPLVFSSLAFGCVLTVRPNLGIALPALWLYAVLAPRGHLSSRFVAGALFLVGPLAGVAADLAYNWMRYGSILDFAYSGESFSSSLYIGLWGLLLSPGRGLFVYSPALLLAIVGGVAFCRRHRAEAALLLAVSLTLIVFYAKWWDWAGGYCWGPRFLLPIVPLLMPLVAEAWDRIFSGGRVVRGAAAVVMLAAVAVQVPGVAIDPLLYHHIALQQEVEPVVSDLIVENTLFTPQFTPLAANTWLLKWSIIRALRHEPVDIEEVLDDSPWARRRPSWRPKFPTAYLVPQQWYWRRAELAPGVGLAAVLVYLAVAGSGAIATAVLLVAIVRRRQEGLAGHACSH